MRYVLFLALMLAGVMSLWIAPACSSGQGPLVEVDTIKRCTIRPYITETATIRPVLEVPISPDVSGEVVQIYVKEGDTVRTGQVLMTIRPDNYQVALMQTQAAVEAARADYLTAQANAAAQEATFLQDSLNFVRAQQLYEKKAISEAEWDAARIRYLAAQSQVKSARSTVQAAFYRLRSAEANLQQARINYQRTSVYASTNGIITRLLVKPGQRVVGVGQMAGTESIRIADLSAFLAELQVSEADVVHLSPGNPAEIELQAYPNLRLKGYVQEVGYSSGTAKPEGQTALVGEQVATYLVRVRIDSTAHDRKKYLLRPDMSAVVRIYYDQRDNARCAPLEAVSLRDSQEVVFVYQDGKALQKPVRSGVSDDKNIELLEGPPEGTLLIVRPYETLQTLRDSTPVRLKSR